MRLVNVLFFLFPHLTHLNNLLLNRLLNNVGSRILLWEIYCLLSKQHLCLRNNFNLLRHQHWHLVKKVLCTHRVFIVYVELLPLFKFDRFLCFIISAYLHKYIFFARHKFTVKWRTVLFQSSLAQPLLNRLNTADYFLLIIGFVLPVIFFCWLFDALTLFWFFLIIFLTVCFIFFYKNL